MEQENGDGLLIAGFFIGVVNFENDDGDDDNKEDELLNALRIDLSTSSSDVSPRRLANFDTEGEEERRPGAVAAVAEDGTSNDDDDDKDNDDIGPEAA